MNPLLYELPIFQHVDVKSVRDALSCFQHYGEKAKVIAGGTDLLGLMKDRIEGPRHPIPEVLVNVKSIPEMNRITYDKEAGLRIGAAVPLNHLETSEGIKKGFGILSQAARQVGSTQIRFMGTIGGNLCQRPRCLYFRHFDFLCHKRGGNTCYAIAGEHRNYHAIMKYGKCVMAHPSDMAPGLIALNARVRVAAPGGEREIALKDFFLESNPLTETVLKPDEFITEIQVPNPGERTYQLFLKHRIRHSVDFALASVATVAQISEGMCREIRIVLGGIAPIPLRASQAEDIVRGGKLSEEIIAEAAEASVNGARPLPMNRYKVDLTKALVRRVLTSLWQEALNSP